MASRRILANAEIDVRHRQAVPPGEERPLDLWTLLITDPDSLETIEVTVGKDTRDEIVSRLTGGIVLAGGELPNVRSTI